jgi:hypothetical protein
VHHLLGSLAGLPGLPALPAYQPQPGVCQAQEVVVQPKKHTLGLTHLVNRALQAALLHDEPQAHHSEIKVLTDIFDND